MAKPKLQTTSIVEHSPLAEFAKIRSGIETELATFEEDLAPYIAENQEDLALLAEILKTTKGHEKKSTAMMKSALEPIDEKRIEIQQVFKPIIERLKSLERLIKTKVGDYHQKQEKKQFVALEAAARANMSGNAVRAESALARADQAAVEPIKGLTIRYTIDIEIENEDLIPDDWWVVDEARIGKYARATNGEIPIPGVVYHKRPIVGSKSF